uniref:Adipocyte plasma membrane-associated protein n=1 Tax=Lygus hesperus TaxID=30085 RepID=A0A0A9Y7D4_LYGHE
MPNNIDPAAAELPTPPTFPLNTILANATVVFKDRVLISGPEHLAVDETLNRGYVGTLTGRIVALDMDNPYTSVPLHICDIGEPYKALPSPCGKYDTLDICGRVLGLVVDDNHNLIVADASKGIYKLDLHNKLKIPLAQSIEVFESGVVRHEKLNFVNSLQLDSVSERIFFSISSRKFTLKDLFLDILEFRPNGALAM